MEAGLETEIYQIFSPACFIRLFYQHLHKRSCFFALNLSSLGCGHLGSLFTRKVHKKAGSWLACLQHVSFVTSLIQTVEHKTDFKLQFLTNWTKNQMKNWCLLFIPPPLIGLCDTLFPFKNIPIRNPYSTAINRVSWFFILVRFLFKKRTIRNPTLW